MLYIPLTTTPLGWLALGIGGYALYKMGKKKGEDEAAAAEISEISALPTPEEETEVKEEK